jgi:hypothetical protein
MLGSMGADAQLDKLAMLAAEEVLRTIYGDDFTGCNVRPETVAGIIREVITQRAAKDRGLMECYEKVVEGVHLLSTPPDISKVADPNALRSLLSERLDAIHAITTQTIETTGRLNS